MNDCIFCKIVEGALPSHVIYENESILAFLTISPVQEGHVLVIPKIHAEDIFSIEEAAWARVMEAVRFLSPKIKQVMEADGINIIMNNQRAAGQLVDHVHIHIIPRFHNDGLEGFPHHDAAQTALVHTAEKIRSTF